MTRLLGTIWPIFSTLLLLACSQPPKVALDLLALPATSRVAFGQIEVGTAAGQHYLRDGWPFPEPGVIPDSPGLRTAGLSAKLRFCLLLPTELTLEARYEHKGAAPADVKISCNERAVGQVRLVPGGGQFSLTLPEDALAPGLNHFTLSFPAPTAPNTVWHSFSLTPRDGQTRVEGENLIVPPEGAGDFYFRAPEKARFQADIRFSEVGDRLQIEFASADSQQPRRFTVDEDGPCRLDLGPVSAGQPCRLTLIGGQAEVRLKAPAITGDPDPALPLGSATTQGPGELGPPGPKNDKVPKAPLVLFLCVDTLRADVLGPYGAKPSLSPRLDAAGLEVFGRVSAQSGWTKSAMASVFTGRTVLEHGVLGFRDKIPEQEVTLAESMRSLGYRTVGLTANRWTNREFGFAQGFDRYESISAVADVGVDLAIKELDKHTSEQPMFLYLHLLDPHDPYEPPQAFRPPGSLISDASEEQLLAVEELVSQHLPVDPAVMGGIRALYGGEVRFTDQQIGRLFDYLKSAGLYEQALIVVFSDHGEEFGEHNKMRHGNSLYEELLWVPWLMKVPVGRGKTLVFDSVAQHIDMMPTILGLVGSDCPDQVEGVDLAAVPTELLKRRVSLAYLEYGADADLVGVDATPWLRQYESATGYGYKLHLRRIDSLSPRRPLLEFFELAGDPAEKKDLSHLGKVEMGLLWAELETARRRATAPQQADLNETRDAFRSLPYMR